MNLQKLHIFFALIISFGIVSSNFAQSNEAFLYGEILLKSGESIKGQIRWGNEELMWDDMFMGFKDGAPFNSERRLAVKENQQNSVFSHFNFDFMQLWENRGQFTRYNFKCQFGDIHKIKVISDNKARVYFKNGQRIQVSKSQENDIGETIHIYSYTGLEQQVSWGNIDIIQFLPFPEGRANFLGEPIYGKVETTNGIFEGFLAWDREERVGSDRLGGYKDGQKEDIPFGLLKRIDIEGDGCQVTLKSGEVLLLRDYPDVNNENEGILVKREGLGNVLIHWEELISVEFIEPKLKPLYYRDFFITHYLQGTVTDKNGNTFLGRIVYDIDEYLSLEVLDGTQNNVEYYIPFKYISTIKKQNSNYTKVCLKSGAELLLSEHADVNADNQGIIIEAYGRKNLYVSWRELKFVNFK